MQIVFLLEIAKVIETLIPRKFHDFPRTCCKSNWRLLFLPYFGSDFCKKTWFTYEKEFSHLQFEFTWKAGFSWKFSIFHVNRIPDLKIINFGLVFVGFSHTRRTVVDDCFSATARAESAPERMQNTKIIFIFKEIEETCSGPLKIALFWRLVCRGPGPGNAACSKSDIFLKIDAFS